MRNGLALLLIVGILGAACAIAGGLHVASADQQRRWDKPISVSQDQILVP
jgi:hypothetical protein